MPIKKSMVLLLAFTAGSVCLLVFSFRNVAAPTKKCCQQIKNTGLLSPHNMLTQSIFHLSA